MHAGRLLFFALIASASGPFLSASISPTLFCWYHRSRSNSLSALCAVLKLDNLCLTKCVDRYNEQIVVLAFGDHWKVFSAQDGRDRRHGIVVSGYEDSLPTMIGKYLFDEFVRLVSIEQANIRANAIRQWFNRLLCSLELRGVDRIDAGATELSCDLLCASPSRRTQIRIGIAGFDVFLSMANQNYGGDGPRKRREICKHNNCAEHGEEHGENDNSSQFRPRCGRFVHSCFYPDYRVSACVFKWAATIAPPGN